MVCDGARILGPSFGLGPLQCGEVVMPICCQLGALDKMLSSTVELGKDQLVL